MSGFKEIDSWLDITKDFTQASEDVKTGELITNKGFDLFNGVRALEVSYMILLLLCIKQLY